MPRYVLVTEEEMDALAANDDGKIVRPVLPGPPDDDDIRSVDVTDTQHMLEWEEKRSEILFFRGTIWQQTICHTAKNRVAGEGAMVYLRTRASRRTLLAEVTEAYVDLVEGKWLLFTTLLILR